MHLPGQTAVTTSVLPTLAAGALAGLAAAVVMDVPMSRQSEGFTPAYVAAGVLRRTTPDAVSVRDALVVHHLAGVLAGVIYAVVAGVVAVLTGSGGRSSPDVLAPALVPHVAGVFVVVLFIYLVFAHVVLPRAGGTIYERRATAVRGQWLRSSLVFGAAMALLAPVLLSALE
jgi:hypothetical protein